MKWAKSKRTTGQESNSKRMEAKLTVAKDVEQ